jgi:acyl-coenzyme A thioesterase 9
MTILLRRSLICTKGIATSSRIQIHKRLLRTSSVYAQQSDIATPLQERDNVRNILSLAQEVRKEANKDGSISTKQANYVTPKKEHGTLNKRWVSKSWNDVVHAKTVQSNAKFQLSQELEQKLQKPKRMMQSYASFPLRFRDEPEVLEGYISSWGGIRIGKVLEDLDSLAGEASYKHVLGSRPTESDHEINPIFIVTASVDRLDLLEHLRADRNYRLNGMVIYVGSSSMEVLVTVEDVSDVEDGESDAARAVLTGRFTMATRNAATGKAQSIPPLQIQNSAEDQLFAQGQAHKQRKRFEAQTSLEKVPPTSDEATLLHQLWLTEEAKKSKVATDEIIDTKSESVYIEDTQLASVSFMHPQQRNVHMKIFGGYLMRSAYELAYMNAITFANGKPVKFLSLDALSFHLPVSIGAILSLTSRITYTSGSTPNNEQTSVASVVVLAEVVDTKTGEKKRSNTFHFSFDFGPDAKKVLPESYRDSIAFLEGKRRVDLGNELRRISQPT